MRTLVNHCLLHFNLQEQSEMLSHLGWADGNGHELPPFTPGVRVGLLLVSLSSMIRDLHSFHEDCYIVNLPTEDKHPACYTTMSKIPKSVSQSVVEVPATASQIYNLFNDQVPLTASLSCTLGSSAASLNN